MSPGDSRERFFVVHVRSVGPCPFFLQFFLNVHRKQAMVHLSIINTDLFPVYRVVFCFSQFKTSPCSYSFLQPPAIASVCVCVCVCLETEKRGRLGRGGSREVETSRGGGRNYGICPMIWILLFKFYSILNFP